MSKGGQIAILTKRNIKMASKHRGLHSHWQLCVWVFMYQITQTANVGKVYRKPGRFVYSR